jgi:hypothetical protein
VLRLPLREASAKIRTGDPIDDEEDYGLDIWASVLPLRLSVGAAVADGRLTFKLLEVRLEVQSRSQEIQA